MLVHQKQPAHLKGQAMTPIWIILAIALLLVGAAGTIYPVLPSLPFMLAGAWLLAFAQQYEVISSTALWLIAVLCALGMAMDFVAGVLGAKYTGASQTALWGAFIGGLSGLVLGIVGIIIGPLLGAAIGEFVARRDILLAGKVGIGTFVGFIIGTVVKIGAALTVLLICLANYVIYWTT
ncbi:DUF456 family protein [Kingella kingae]|uniref:DUF456 domain-containing protein n=1 Tax=Kingella kingae TaxID=504 RepID=UPI00254EA6D0|nr:DUF456 family protein [Kingella kingae]MDK4649644.1 DUF456 family protein [Kingella kingae]